MISGYEKGSGCTGAPREGQITTSIIVPVYNEENVIERVIKDIHLILSHMHSDHEILVVDDGSTDSTPDILKHCDGIKYIRHDKNIGYGAALKTGVRNAKGDAIVITDGDGTYPTEIIPDLLRDLVEFDMVVGARANNDRNIPLLRRPVKWVLGKLANYLSETNIPDLNSGLRAFKRDVALRFYKILPSGFSFTTTITLAMHCNGYKVEYIPIKYHRRKGKSKFRPFHDTVNFVQLIVRTIMYFNPLKIFLPIAAVMFGGFVMSLVFDIAVLRNVTDKSVILFLAFVQVAVIGLLADLIDKRNI